MLHLGHLFGSFIGQELRDHRFELTNYARAFAEFGQRTTAADFLSAMEHAGRMYASLGPILEKHRLLICPTLAVPAVTAEHDPTDPDFTINGVKVDAMLQWCLTYPFNTMSRCPVMSVPSGRAASGVPTGIQLVGRTYDDVSVFQAAAAFERAQPWLHDAAHRPKF